MEKLHIVQNGIMQKNHNIDIRVIQQDAYLPPCFACRSLGGLHLGMLGAPEAHSSTCAHTFSVAWSHQ